MFKLQEKNIHTAHPHKTVKIFFLVSACLALFSTTLSYASEDHHDHHHEHHHEKHDDTHHEHHHADHDDEFMQHEAHVHGHAHASVSYSEKKLILSFRLPSIDVFGFEHAANNDQEQIAIEQATETLSLIDNIVIVAPKCIAQKHIVNSEHHSDSSSNEGHSDVTIDIHMTCESDAEHELTFSLLETLATLETLSVDFISDHHQSQYTLTKSEKSFTAH